MPVNMKAYAGCQLIDAGYDLTVEDGKKPFLNDWINNPLTKREIEHWMGRGRYNLAILIRRDLVVVDIDDLSHEWFARMKEVLTSPMTCLSSRGKHFYFRGNGVEGGKLPCGDLKTKGAITVPPSEHPTGWRYQWENG